MAGWLYFLKMERFLLMCFLICLSSWLFKSTVFFLIDNRASRIARDRYYLRKSFKFFVYEIFVWARFVRQRLSGLYLVGEIISKTINGLNCLKPASSPIFRKHIARFWNLILKNLTAFLCDLSSRGGMVGFCRPISRVFALEACVMSFVNYNIQMREWCLLPSVFLSEPARGRGINEAAFIGLQSFVFVL